MDLNLGIALIRLLERWGEGNHAYRIWCIHKNIDRGEGGSLVLESTRRYSFHLQGQYEGPYDRNDWPLQKRL